jgi:hypothetical protein
MAASTLEFPTMELSAVTVGFMGLAFGFGPLMIAEYENLSRDIHDFGFFSRHSATTWFLRGQRRG